MDVVELSNVVFRDAADSISCSRGRAFGFAGGVKAQSFQPRREPG